MVARYTHVGHASVDGFNHVHEFITFEAIEVVHVVCLLCVKISTSAILDFNAYIRYYLIAGNSNKVILMRFGSFHQMRIGDSIVNTL